MDSEYYDEHEDQSSNFVDSPIQSDEDDGQEEDSYDEQMDQFEEYNED